MQPKYTIIIVGAGKVGTAIGTLLHQKDHRIVAAAAAHQASLETTGRYLPAAYLSVDLREIARYGAKADIILLTTQDDQIQPTCETLAAYGTFTPRHTVMHMSGASTLDVLASACVAGAGVASIHPIQSFASAELAIEKIPGSYFGVTADDGARDVALAVVRDLGGVPIDIQDEDKAMYHAAACITSNYLVTLLHMAEKVYNAAGLRADIALDAMMTLISGTLSNIEKVGTIEALTGPIARGDVTIIKQHLQSLRRLDANIERAYRVLGLQTVDVAVKKGTLSAENAAELIAVLEDRSC
ncbi:MAG TPA: Rossmann-like and DUF2520 domain-containing protein [Candidatus Aquicultor sp.]|jgi:predicted short-subunit dehydrogenase-like oxidoreductase (DUF2520 family)